MTRWNAREFVDRSEESRDLWWFLVSLTLSPDPSYRIYVPSPPRLWSATTPSLLKMSRLINVIVNCLVVVPFMVQQENIMVLKKVLPLTPDA